MDLCSGPAGVVEIARRFYYKTFVITYNEKATRKRAREIFMRREEKESKRECKRVCSQKSEYLKNKKTNVITEMAILPPGGR